jgi:hypothetical protein
MSITKRVWIDRDPAYADVRKRYADETWRYIKEFEFRIPMRRNKAGSRSPDRWWLISLERAVRQFEVEVVRVNGGMFFRTVEQRDACLARAEEIWKLRPAERGTSD